MNIYPDWLGLPESCTVVRETCLFSASVHLCVNSSDVKANIIHNLGASCRAVVITGGMLPAFTTGKLESTTVIRDIVSVTTERSMQSPYKRVIRA